MLTVSGSYFFTPVSKTATIFGWFSAADACFAAESGLELWVSGQIRAHHLPGSDGTAKAFIATQIDSAIPPRPISSPTSYRPLIIRCWDTVFLMRRYAAGPIVMVIGSRSTISFGHFI